MLYLGVHFDSAAAPVELGDRTLVMPSLAARAGDTLLTMAMQAAWDQGSWRVTADQAAVKSHQLDWRASEPVRLSGDAQGVAFDRLTAQDGDARLDIGGRWAIPGGSYDWRAQARGLDLARLGLPDSLRLRGRADVDLTVRGMAGDPRWELHGVASRPGMQRVQVDSLALDLAGAPSSLDVTRLGFALGGGWVESRGLFRETARAWPDTLTPDGVTRWLASAARWSGDGQARAVSLAPAARALGGPADWSGMLNGSLQFAGRPSQPTFDVNLEARPLAWRNVRLDRVTAQARYADQKLHVDQLRGTRDSTVSSVSGDIETQLAFGRPARVLDAPMHWTVDVPNGNLSLLSILVPQIGYANGRVFVRGDVRGTPRHPTLEGTAGIEDGKLRLAGRDELLEGVRARIRFAASSITLDTLTAVQRSRERGIAGRVAAHGRVDLTDHGPPHYRFDVALRDFTAAEEGLYAARFDGNFVVRDGSRVEGQVLPHITSDDVEIRRAVILYDFTRQTEVEQVKASTQKLYWTYLIHVHANDNLRWQPQDGDIDFSADLNLDQTPEKLVIFGDMDALRGTYYFLSNRFNVTNAKLTFDDVGGIDPVVDASATKRLIPTTVVTSATDARPAPHTITVNITGRSSAPAITFTSDPGDLDEAQILRELTVGRLVTSTDQPVPLVDPFDSYLTRALSRQLSPELSRAFRGYLTDWEIARQQGAGAQGPLMVGFGTQLSNQVMLRYQQVLPGTGRYTPVTNETMVERDLEAEYRLNRFFYVTSQLTQKRTAAGTTTSVSGTPDFNVNLKARWEY